MIFKRDNLTLGLFLGILAPLIGLIFLKFTRFAALNVYQLFQYMIVEPGYKTLTSSLTVSLLVNAILFTIYINTNRDNTAKGIFITTMVYGAAILLVKTFY